MGGRKRQTGSEKGRGRERERGNLQVARDRDFAGGLLLLWCYMLKSNQ